MRLILLEAGLGCLLNAEEKIDIESLVGIEPLLNPEKGSIKVQMGSLEIPLPLELVTHALDTGPIIYMYQEGEGVVAVYLGLIELSRDDLLKASGVCEYMAASD